MSKVLVIGGGGFLGAHLVPFLKDQGFSVTVQDLAPKSAVKAKIPDVDFEHRWKSLVDMVSDDVAGFDYILNLAAQADVPLSITSPLYTTTQNLMGSLCLLEAVRHAQPYGHLKKVLFMSSESVYGNTQFSGHPFLEELPLSPTNAYSASKVAVEAYAHAYATQFEIPIVVVRSTTMFGPKGRLDQVVPIFIRQALTGQSITIEGDGSQTRDFNYVGNSIHGITQAFLKGGSEIEHYRIYNIGSGISTSIKHLAQEIVKVTGSRSEIETRAWRPGEQGLKLSVSIKRAQQELGYSPTFTLAEGLAKTVDWIKSKGS